MIPICTKTFAIIAHKTKLTLMLIEYAPSYQPKRRLEQRISIESSLVSLAFISVWTDFDSPKKKLCSQTHINAPSYQPKRSLEKRISIESPLASLSIKHPLISALMEFLLLLFLESKVDA